MTTRSISLPEGRMPISERRGSNNCSRAVPPTPKLRGLLKVALYPYQAEGALFAVRTGRALIGDDMGLGKTIQAIAATEILARHFGVSFHRLRQR